MFDQKAIIRHEYIPQTLDTNLPTFVAPPLPPTTPSPYHTSGRNPFCQSTAFHSEGERRGRVQLVYCEMILLY